MKQKTTEEKIEICLEWLRDFLTRMTFDDPVYFNQFIKTSEDDLILYHNTLGMAVRNGVALWEYSWEKNLINGIDHSDGHPDQVSFTAIRRVHEEFVSMAKVASDWVELLQESPK